jgi:hypothetical protein
MIETKKFFKISIRLFLKILKASNTFFHIASTLCNRHSLKNKESARDALLEKKTKTTHIKIRAIINVLKIIIGLPIKL